MINRFSIGKKSFRLVCVFSVMVLGMWFLSACDSAENLVKDIVDLDFEKDATISLDAITVQKQAAVITAAALEECGTTGVGEGLKKLESQIEDLDLVDIESVELNYLNASYSNASWTPETETLTCRLTITGTQNTEIAETAINGASGIIDVNLTDEQIGVINYYLSNRSEKFEYCVECDNDLNFDTYSVTYSVDINVLIKGNI